MNTQELRAFLADKTIGIAGAGGLGSNAAVALARIGLGKIIVADFDIIESSNLNRQYYFNDQVGQAKVHALKENINRIDTSISVITHHIKLNENNLFTIFDTPDVLIEAFDRADQKQMIIETTLSLRPELPLVVGLGMAGWGKSNQIKVRQEGQLYICGDEVSEIDENLPPLAPRVGMVANMMANVALAILMNKPI